VTTADVQDRGALPNLLKPVSARSPWVKLAFVDGGYAGDDTQHAACEASRIRLTVVKRTDREVKGFIVLLKGWIVERIFGWVNRAHRPAKDFERSITFARLGSCSPWLSCSSAGSPGTTRRRNFESGF
jgi:transposase